MRNWTLASLVLIGSGIGVAACNGGGSTTDTSSTGGSGVGATGGTSNTGGGSLGGAATGGSTAADGCTNTTVATGTPVMIDDFEATSGSTEGMGGAPGNWALLPAFDSRVGQWAHASFLNTAGNPDVSPAGQFEIKDGATRFWCAAGADADMAQCNTALDPERVKPFYQWAAYEVGLQAWTSDTDLNCYDASQFTGIKFKHKAGPGTATNKFRVQLKTPDTNTDSGETFQSPTYNTEADWVEETIPFTMIKQPSWSTVKKPFNPAGLITISFIPLNSTVDAKDKSEKLEAYDIMLDDVQFYK